MHITVVGTGYVGLVSGVCFADLGHCVTCVDKDVDKIARLNRLEMPIYEPGLKELVEENVNAGRLSFRQDIAPGLETAEVVVIAVGTPSLPDGAADLSFVEQVAVDIAQHMNGYKIIMTKSTVPVGTNDKIKHLIRSLTNQPFDVVSVPEFLREGSAVKDAFNPDRIVIGTDSKRAEEKIVALHRPLTDHILTTDIRSAEMIKYASNAFLATKISFINEIANICDKVGADVTKVAEGMGYDKRIGSAFLNAGIGYGGSCFPKDTKALIQIAGNVDYDFKLLKSVVHVNEDQRYNVIEKLTQSLGSLSGKTIGIWGLAFKPNTDDVREAPSIEIVDELVKLDARVKVYDPVAMDNFRSVVNSPRIEWCSDALEAAKDCEALCLLTEWDEFKNVDLQEVESVMRRAVLVDGRNVFTREQIEQTHFEYYSIGRPNIRRGEEPVTVIQ